MGNDSSLKLIDKINNLERNDTFFSFEFFPPKTQQVSIIESNFSAPNF